MTAKWTSSAALLLGMLGCSAVEGDADESCAPGTLDCSCTDKGCVGELSCVEQICVDPSEAGESDGNLESDDGLGDGSSDDGSSPSGPMIVDFGANLTQLTEGESLIFTATVIDPDGPDDIQGGSLKNEDGSLTYRAFEDIGNGTFGVTISWNELHLASAIEFGDRAQRGFRADFFDNSGNVDTRTTSVELYCESGSGVRACDGACVSLADDSDNCGECGRACSEESACVAGTCSFAWSPCLNQGEETVTNCAEFCASIGETCAAECGPFRRVVSLWTEPDCPGNPNFSESDEVACGLGAPESIESAQCCCTAGAMFP